MENLNKPGFLDKPNRNSLPFWRFVGLLFILFSAIPFNSAAQTLPKVISPSPETAALFKAWDYPVDYATGVPAINIPVYEVRSGTLTLPISLSYHASGRKVADQNGPIALGWSLNAGGMISRTVYGTPDFGSPSVGTYPFANPLLLEEQLSESKTEADFNYLAGIEHYRKAINYGRGVDTWRDAEYDIFSYNLIGTSGKFIFKDSLGVRIPALVPIKPYIIEWEGKHLSFINITDDKGTVYRFGQGEDYLHQGTTSVVTNWTIRTIISADKKDTISFKYTGFYREIFSVSQQYILKDNWQITQNSNPAPFPEEDYFSWQQSPNMGNGYQMQRLTEIKFKEGIIKFNLYTDMPRESSLHTDMVKEIQILDKENKVVKTIGFTQSFLNAFADGSPAVNKLDQIQFRNGEGHTIDTYSFDYYPVKFLSANRNYIDLKHCDWWGYYNASGAEIMLAPVTVNFMGSGGSSSTQTFGSVNYNRKPSLEAIKSGVLKKVTYPTGGSIEFSYGLNKYKDDRTSQQEMGGGIRIEQSKTSDSRGNVYYKTYEYRTKGFGETDWGIMQLQPHPEYMASEFRYMHFNYGTCVSFEPTCMAMGGSYRERTFYSGFLPSLNALAEKPVVYDMVTEYQGTKENNIGKTVYHYDFFRQSPGALAYGSGISMHRYHVYMNRLWQENVLVNKEVYEKAAGGENYKLRKQIVNRYEDIVKEEVKGLHVERTHIFPQDKTLYDAAAGSKYVDLYASVYWQERTQVYAYRSYVIAIGAKNLVSTSEMDITDSGTVFTQTTDYKYNPKQLVSEIRTVLSDKRTIITQKKYPFDLSADPVHQLMISKNMLDFEVEQNQYLDTTAATPLQSLKTTYKNWGNNIIAPESISKRLGDKPYKPVVWFHAYDLATGNILRVSKQKDVNISYIWGYNKTFPIAECRNAAENEIFYDGFEDHGTTGTAHAGKKFHDGDYNLTFVIPDAKTYVLRYWYRENGAWKHTGLLNYAGPQTLSLGDAIDEVRIHPAGALMTTFTYQPLVGMTSATDPNNKVSYYEYDSYGRLKYVRDEEHNILSAYQYHYQVR